jgi:hypothetical protein
VVRGHRVQQADAIFTGGQDFAAPEEIEPGRCLAKLIVAGSHNFSFLQIRCVQLLYDPRDPSGGDAAVQLLDSGR